MPRSQRSFYFLIIGVLVGTLLFCILILTLWMNVNYQAMADAREFKAAGFRIKGPESEEEAKRGWLASFEKSCFSDDPPRRWRLLEVREQDLTAEITPDKIAVILSRQRGLQEIFLPTSCVDEHVLQQMTKLRRLNGMVIRGTKPLDDEWLTSLRKETNWTFFAYDAPGISPAGAAAVLQRSPKLDQLSLRDDAIDDAVTDEILARPIRMLTVYFDNGPHSPAAIRLVNNFVGEYLWVCGAEGIAADDSFPPLQISLKNAKRSQCNDIPHLEIDGAAPVLYLHSCNQVVLTNAEGPARIIEADDVVVQDCPLLTHLVVEAKTAKIVDCPQLELIYVRQRSRQYRNTNPDLTLENLPGLRRYTQESSEAKNFAELAKCPSLFSVQVYLGSAETAESLKLLSALPNLQTLVLKFDTTDFTHPWLEQLEKLPHLKNLILLQAYHSEGVPLAEWSTFHAKFPAGFKSVHICLTQGPAAAETEGWKAMTERYSAAGISFSARESSPWEVPEELMPLTTGPNGSPTR